MPILSKHCSRSKIRQTGATLIELMVGITIGLLTVAVGLAAIVMTRGISGTVSEASQMQQQARMLFALLASKYGKLALFGKRLFLPQRRRPQALQKPWIHHGSNIPLKTLQGSLIETLKQ